MTLSRQYPRICYKPSDVESDFFIAKAVIGFRIGLGKALGNVVGNTKCNKMKSTTKFTC